MTEQSSGTGTRRDLFVAVRSRTTIGAGRSSVDLTAPCPVLGRDVPIEECIQCPQGGGLVVGRTPKDTSVCCRVETPASEAGELGADGRRADRTPISAIMTTHVVCVSPDLELPALECLLVEKGVSGVPVVDAAGCPVGIVSKTDILLERQETAQPSPDGDQSPRTVGDIMMPIPFCLPANESIAKAAALMAFEAVHRVPVLGAAGQVVGVVSPLDVLRWLAREHGYVLGAGD
jgi:CBS domain-containing protein